MPFKSEAQRRYLWANEPKVAREFADKEKLQTAAKAKLKRKLTPVGEKGTMKPWTRKS